jgi:uncharacterized integral membrane protein (TIGR00697 family)
MLSNELLFIFHIAFSGLITLWALHIGKEALIALIALQGLIANLLISKQIELVGFEVTTTDVCMINAVIGLNFLQEFYGSLWAKKAIRISLASSCWSLGILFFHLKYLPSPNDYADSHMQVIFAILPRIVLASISVSWAIQYLERKLYAFIKVKFPKASFTLRNCVSIALTQTLDTLIFSFVGLWGIVASLENVIVMSLVAKALVLLVASPFMALAIKLIRLGLISHPSENR